MNGQAGVCGRIGLVLCLLLIAAWMVPPAVQACPGCKEALVDPAEAQLGMRRAKGYAVSIGLLLAVPLLMVGGVTTAVVRHARGVRQPR